MNTMMETPMVCLHRLLYEIHLNDTYLSEGKDPLFIARAMENRGIALVFNES